MAVHVSSANWWSDGLFADHHGPGRKRGAGWGRGDLANKNEPEFQVNNDVFSASTCWDP